MGNLRLDVTAGKKKELIELETGHSGESTSHDQVILAAMKRVGAVKDEGHQAAVQELTSTHEAKMTELETQKNQEIALLRTPIIADLIIARSKVIKDLDVANDQKFYEGMATPRLLDEFAHWSDSSPVGTVTKDTPAKPPEKLEPQEDSF